MKSYLKSFVQGALQNSGTHVRLPCCGKIYLNFDKPKSMENWYTHTPLDMIILTQKEQAA